MKQFIQRTYTDQKPNTITKLGKGKYYYNYDITEIKNADDSISYSYIQVLMNSRPNYYTCTSAVIRKYISESEEFEVVNDYLAFTLNKGGNKDNYIQYLDLVLDIKKKVGIDFPDKSIR